MEGLDCTQTPAKAGVPSLTPGGLRRTPFSNAKKTFVEPFLLDLFGSCCRTFGAVRFVKFGP